MNTIFLGFILLILVHTGNSLEIKDGDTKSKLSPSVEELCNAYFDWRMKSKLSPSVEELCNAYFDWRMTDMPQYATFVGIHDYDDRLDDMSNAAYLQRYTQCEYFLSEANKLLLTLTDDADIVNIKVLKYELLTYIDSFHLKGYLLPINYLEGIQVDMEKQFGWMLRNTTEDYDKMISRLQEIPIQITQTINLLKEGVDQGIQYHNISMKNMNESLSRFVVEDPTDSPFWVYFQDDSFPSSFSQEEIASIQSQASLAINGYVTPAYDALREYIVNDYVTRPDIAVTTITNGQEFYQQLINFHTSTNLTAQEIQDIGYVEVDRIEREMQKIITDLGYGEMSIQGFSDMIRNDPNNYYDNTDDLFAGFENISYNVIPPKLPIVFNSIPSTPLLLVEDPDPNDPVAFFLAGAYDGSRPGIFYINTYSPNVTQKYRMMTLALHEGDPGHHFQSSYAIESEEYPYFRRVMEDRNYGISPSRFPIYTFYVEGWALYSEGLGFDMNLFDNQLDAYGHYSDEVFRACRLVVDTGMHALGWSREQAIDYMFNHTASSRFDVENEVDRYITWPGQALAYKMGQLKLLELRQKSEQELQNLFDIKDFHDVILSSLGSMDIVEDQVNKYIEETLNSGLNKDE